MDWLLQKLAARLGVEAARAGEAITPRIRFEQPWPQAVTVAVLLGSAALIIWLYRRERSATTPYRMFLAFLRFSLVMLTVLMLSEAVLSVERTGLPYFAIMIDDSASEQVVDQYADNKAGAIASEFAAKAAKSKVDRLAVAQGILSENGARIFKELQAQHKVRLYLVAAAARPLAQIDSPEDVSPALAKLMAVEANGSQTRLGAGVRQVLGELRGVPPSAILIFTDGQTTDGETLDKAAEFAAKKGVPIFTVGLGDAEPARDLELSELLVDDIVFVDDLVRFQAKLGSRGFAGEQVTVTLKERPTGAVNPSSDKILETVRAKAPADGGSTKVEIGYRPRETGEKTFVLEVETRPRELQVENNVVTRVVNVRKEKLKVLLVDSEPRYEFRYLKNFLEREETIDLGVVLLSSDTQFSEQDRSALPTFPASKEDLFTYDVVLIGDADPSFMSSVQMTNLVEFVTEKGGGVLFIAGENFNPLTYRGTPLEFLLPIELADARNPTAVGNSLTSFRPELTAEGRTNPIFRFGDDEATSTLIWKTLPELFWFFEAPRKKPAALVLAEHPTLAGSNGRLPLMLYQFVGVGKTMFNAVDDTWRWRYRAGDKYFGRYWIQTIRFLARSKLLGQRQAEITTDRRRYQRGQSVLLRVRFPNPALAPTTGDIVIDLERKGQGPRKLTLKSSPNNRGLFEAALPQLSEGDYEVRLLPPPVLDGPIPTYNFRVEPPAGELEQVTMNQAELQRAATVSGGKFYTPSDLSTLMSDLPKPQKVPLDTDPPIPLWNTWPLMALFLGIVTLEWVLRKRKQMV